ncbi:MAG: glycosyltransferase [Pseudoxanthomonas sp.]
MSEADAAPLRTAIVLCTYNGAEFLREQLDSFLRQVRLPDEIVIADDASTDATWPTLQAFADDARQRGIGVDLQRNPANLGYVCNFGAALARATAELVFLSDQDDIWHVEKLARMTREFERRPGLGLLHTDARLVDRGGRDLGHGLFEAFEITAEEIAREHAGDAFEVLLRRNTATGATMALRRDLLARLLPVPEGWVHDEWLAMGVSLMAQVDCLEWRSIDYRQHGGNQIGARIRSAREKLLGAGASKREFMAKVAQRLAQTQERIAAAGLALPPDKTTQLRERIAHARFRASLPTAALRRFRDVSAEAASGRYGRYSSGLRSIVSDLLDMN